MTKFHYRESPTPRQRAAFAPYLSEDEDLVLVTGLSHAFMRNQFLVYMLFPGTLLAALGAGLAWFVGLDKMYIAGIFLGLMVLTGILKTIHLYHANRYLLTTKRVMVKRGLFSVKLTAALYDKITHLEVDQSFIDRLLLHHGDLIINTAGTNKNEIVLKYIDYPLEIKNLLERLINREREQLGIRTHVSETVEGEIVA